MSWYYNHSRISNMSKYQLLFLSIAVAAAFFSAEAFTATSSRGVKYQRTKSTPVGIPSLPSQQITSTSSLPLFPFTRNNYQEIAFNAAAYKQQHYRKSRPLQRRLSNDNNESGDETIKPKAVPAKIPVDPLVALASQRMRRIAFLSWWAQVILTVISGVTLLFTRNVLSLESNAATKAALVPNYFLVGCSLSLSLGSIIWTWATRRLSRRLLRKPTTCVQAANMIRKSITVGTFLNLCGMGIALLGAEQIIGGLAIKVLTTTNAGPAIYTASQTANLLQPLDILVVQANTNTLFSHFCSVVANLFLSRSIGQLDPPSVENDERPREAIP